MQDVLDEHVLQFDFVTFSLPPSPEGSYSMPNHFVYRIASDDITYLVLAPSEAAAVRCLWETEGTSEQEWRELNDDISIGVISQDKWDTIFMHDEDDWWTVSAVVAEMKLGPDEAEVICSFLGEESHFFSQMMSGGFPSSDRGDSSGY